MYSEYTKYPISVHNSIWQHFNYGPKYQNQQNLFSQNRGTVCRHTAEQAAKHIWL